MKRTMTDEFCRALSFSLNGGRGSESDVVGLTRARGHVSETSPNTVQFTKPAATGREEHHGKCRKKLPSDSRQFLASDEAAIRGAGLRRTRSASRWSLAGIAKRLSLRAPVLDPRIESDPAPADHCLRRAPNGLICQDRSPKSAARPALTLT